MQKEFKETPKTKAALIQALTEMKVSYKNNMKVAELAALWNEKQTTPIEVPDAAPRRLGEERSIPWKRAGEPCVARRGGAP